MPDNSDTLFTDDDNHKWHAYLDAANVAGIPPITNPEILKSLKQVFALSDFVAEGCTRDPALPVDLIDSGDITRRYPEDEYHLKLRTVLSAAADEETLSREITAWETTRNEQRATVNWQFTSIDARTKLKRLYPVISKPS